MIKLPVGSQEPGARPPRCLGEGLSHSADSPFWNAHPSASASTQRPTVRPFTHWPINRLLLLSLVSTCTRAHVCPSASNSWQNQDQCLSVSVRIQVKIEHARCRASSHEPLPAPSDAKSQFIGSPASSFAADTSSSSHTRGRSPRCWAKPSADWVTSLCRSLPTLLLSTP